MDYIIKVLECCRKREDNLRNGESVGNLIYIFDQCKKSLADSALRQLHITQNPVSTVV